MRRIGLRPAARRDPTDIWHQTADNFGVGQAERYVEAIRREIENLVEFPDRHPFHSSRHGEFRKASSGRHLVFYLVTNDAIEVVRGLHAQMDLGPQLEP